MSKKCLGKKYADNNFEKYISTVEEIKFYSTSFYG